MSKFHESLRDLLEDVHKFLVGLQTPLSAAALSQKEGLLIKLHHICQDYPQLQLNLLQELSSGSDEKYRDLFATTIDHERTSQPPSSPPPYVDMKGGCQSFLPPSTSPDGIYSDAVDEEYEICNTEKASVDLLQNETKPVVESEDVHHIENEGMVAVAASELANAEKCGYLEKKGKERLGGLLNHFQRRRWYAVKDGVLYYYDRCTDRCQKGQISLLGYEARVVQTTAKDVNKKNFCCFELVCPGKRTYQFIAQTTKDMKQWISAIEQNSQVSTLNNVCIADSKSKAGAIEETTSSYQSEVKQKSGDGFISHSLNNKLSRSDEDIYEMVDEQQTSNKSHSSFDTEVTAEEELYTDAESILSESHSGNNLVETFNPQDWYVGLWDCQGDDVNELTFVRGELIHVISKRYDSYAWWIGELNGKIGLVPKSYLMEAYEVV